MHNLVENLKNLSNQILLAKKQNDYNKIIAIDNDRRIVIDQIFSKGIKSLIVNIFTLLLKVISLLINV